MPAISINDRSGADKRREVPGRFSVMEVIRDTRYDEHPGLYGGGCSCAMCHVVVESAVDPGLPGADEKDLLESSCHRSARSRLSCRIRFTEQLDGLAVRIAPED